MDLCIARVCLYARMRMYALYAHVKNQYVSSPLQVIYSEHNGKNCCKSVSVNSWAAPSAAGFCCHQLLILIAAAR